MEQLQYIDLTTSRRHGIKIKVMDMDVAFAVCLRMLRSQKVHLVICLRTCSTDLQHSAHSCITIYVGIVTLHIADARIHIGDLIDGLHQRGMCFSDSRSVGSVKDVCLGSCREPVIHQFLLYEVLDALDIRCFCYKFRFQISLDCVGNIRRI